GAVDAQRVIGLVADVGVRLRARLDVGADPAVVEQVDRRAQDQLDDVGRRAGDGRGIYREPRPRFVGDLHRLGRARVYAPTGRAQLRGGVGTRRAGKIEQPLAFPPRRFGIGIRVEEHVPVVERGDELEVV